MSFVTTSYSNSQTVISNKLLFPFPFPFPFLIPPSTITTPSSSPSSSEYLLKFFSNELQSFQLTPMFGNRVRTSVVSTCSCISRIMDNTGQVREYGISLELWLVLYSDVALESHADLLLPCSVIALALHNTIVLIITPTSVIFQPYPKSTSQHSGRHTLSGTHLKPLFLSQLLYRRY